MVYIGVDLHRKKSQVAAIDESGGLIFNRKVRTDPGELQQLIDELRPQPVEVAFEATFGWGWFADLLAELGVPAHMAHPLTTKAISTARVKNDSVDAKTLAHLLRANLLPEGWIAPPEVREARRLVRMRSALVRLRAKLKAQVHALLGEHGIQPDVVDIFGRRGRAMLGQLQLRPTSQRRLEACLRLIDEISLEVVLAEREIEASIKQDVRVQRLLPIPGIGLISAATILSEIGDIARFPSADKLCAWAGLTPSEHSSADNVRRGHISKQGSRWLRWIMVEAAVHAYRDPEVRQIFIRVARRRGGKIARVAVARRLLMLVFYALRSESGCRSYPVPLSSTSVEARSQAVMASR
jgi:transposase